MALLLGWQPLPSHVSDEVVVGNPLALEETRYGEGIHRHLRIFTARALAALAEAHGRGWISTWAPVTILWEFAPRA